MKSIVLTLFVSLSISGLNQIHAQELPETFEQLVTWMTGEFDSSEQAQKDTSFHNISLKMTRVWKDKPNGVWLYVEQAVAATPDKPYRQRMYFISELNEDEYSSDIYTLPNEEKFIGAWKETSKLDEITPFDLTNKAGCTVILFYDGFQFGGSTSKGNCKSGLHGATYATSDVTILESEISTWDRGFNDKDEQVWGSESGPYVFKKQ